MDPGFFDSNFLSTVLLFNFPILYYNLVINMLPEPTSIIPPNTQSVSKGKSIGVITVQSFDKNAYNDYHTDIVRSVDIYIGSAIENANLYHDMEESVKKRTA